MQVQVRKKYARRGDGKIELDPTPCAVPIAAQSLDTSRSFMQFKVFW